MLLTIREFGGLKDRRMPAKGRKALVTGRGNTPGLKDQSKSPPKPTTTTNPVTRTKSVPPTASNSSPLRDDDKLEVGLENGTVDSHHVRPFPHS